MNEYTMEEALIEIAKAINFLAETIREVHGSPEVGKALAGLSRLGLS